MTIKEKAAYFKGLTEGMGLDPDSREGKLWPVLAELLGDIAAKLDEHEEALDGLNESMEDVYDQLIFLQEAALDADDFDEDDFDEDGDDGFCAPPLRLFEGEEDEDAPDNGLEDDDEIIDDGRVLYDVTCPGCGETITFDEETLEKGSIQCPNCGETLEFDLGEE